MRNKMTKPTIEELEVALTELNNEHYGDEFCLTQSEQRTIRASLQQSVDIAKGGQILVSVVPSYEMVNYVQDRIKLGKDFDWTNETPQSVIRHVYHLMLSAAEEQK